MPPKTKSKSKSKSKGKSEKKSQKPESKRKSAVQVTQGLDSFRYWNGDGYIGNYQASSVKNVLRKGHGNYVTADGAMYAGEWDTDKFVQGDIHYNDLSTFNGQLDINHKYNQEGIYTVPNVGAMTINFKSNVPQGEIILNDKFGREWFGKKVNRGEIRLFPRNHFKITYFGLATSKQSVQRQSG